MSDTLQGVIVGGFLAGVVAIVTQILAARNQTDAAREANRQQDRVWHRDQRLEAHHAFLNQVNRLTAAIAAFSGPSDPAIRAEAMSDVREVLDRTVDAFNRVELVCSPQLYALAVKILEAADAEQLRRPGQVPVVLQAIGVASRNYREAAKAELGVQEVT
jgi:hypothetical protein